MKRAGFSFNRKDVGRKESTNEPYLSYEEVTTRLLSQVKAMPVMMSSCSCTVFSLSKKWYGFAGSSLQKARLRSSMLPLSRAVKHFKIIN